MNVIEGERGAGTAFALPWWRRREARLHLVSSVERPSRPRPGGRPPRWPWFATALDVLLITGIPGAANALAGVPTLHAVATLGGYPRLVQVLAVMSLVLLMGLGVMTEGFRRLGEQHRSLLVLAGMLSVVAGAGAILLTLFAPVVLVVIGFSALGAT